MKLTINLKDPKYCDTQCPEKIFRNARYEYKCKLFNIDLDKKCTRPQHCIEENGL